MLLNYVGVYFLAELYLPIQGRIQNFYYAVLIMLLISTRQGISRNQSDTMNFN